MVRKWALLQSYCLNRDHSEDRHICVADHLLIGGVHPLEEGVEGEDLRQDIGLREDELEADPDRVQRLVEDVIQVRILRDNQIT